jgi:YegS/Rv2252/BmrU family lipid kinase
MAPRLTILINAAAGTGEQEETRRRLASIFASSDLEVEISLVRNGEEMTDLARRAVANGSRTVVAGGGDGTINAVAAVLVGTNTSLGVLPFGTLNHFAKDLQIPLDLEGAARTIVTGQTIAVDVGEVNGHIFLNNSGMGLYPSIVREREKHQQLGRGKWLGLLLAGFTVLRRFSFLKVRLSADGKGLVRTTPIVFVGNNIYEMEGINMGTRACLDVGQLCLCLTPYNGLRGLVWLSLRALFSRLHKAKDFEMLGVKELRIEARPKQLPVALDGEVIMMKMPLHYRVRPRALRVLVPAGNTDRSG